MFKFETVVVEIFINRMVARNLTSGRSAEVVSTVPFSHPRMLLGDFGVAESVLKKVLGEVIHRRFWMPPPQIVIHPRERLEGGLTVLEHRVMTELAIAVGAAKAGVYEGSGTVTADQAAAILAVPRKR